MTLAAPVPGLDNHGDTTIATTTPVYTDTREVATLPFGSGLVVLDKVTGTPVQFTDTAAPDRTYLLDDEIAWHSLEHAWGTGYVIADGFAGRWNAPNSITWEGARITTQHQIGQHLQLDVERRSGETFEEAYRFKNVGDVPVRITSLGIQTPFADLYPGARDALTRRVHAHIFTGGSWAWSAAQPMNGAGRVLGLHLTKGQLWGYSVETRNAGTISNARGHLVLNVTDHARTPDAFGGQPVLEIAPGEEYVLSWELSWHDDITAFLASTPSPGQLSAFSAEIGAAIAIRTTQSVTAAAGISITTTADGVQVTAETPGMYWIRIGKSSRTEVLFHDSVHDAVRKRSNYVLAYQRSTERQGELANAILPVDTTTRLTQTTNGWSDWTDGSERIGVALMLQHAAMRGWADPSVDDALEGWSAFAKKHLMDSTAAPRRGSQQHHAGIRLYDSPWLARFYLLRYKQHGSSEDLDLAAKLLERAFELGIGNILTIGFSEIATDVGDALENNGQLDRATAIRDAVIASGRHFTGLGENLPGHEVAYEQAIVAPLLNLLIDTHRLTGDDDLLEEIKTRLPWLLAFSGPQPHARLNGVAIRHWDGYWFGQRRQWGDVFPHYWSALTATALLRLPSVLRTSETDELARTILRANMANYSADGSATCAFVMPTSVDGVPAHSADPLANDQDFHLALWMQLELDGHTSLN